MANDAKPADDGRKRPELVHADDDDAEPLPAAERYGRDDSLAAAVDDAEHDDGYEHEPRPRSVLDEPLGFSGREARREGKPIRRVRFGEK